MRQGKAPQCATRSTASHSRALPSTTASWQPEGTPGQNGPAT
jgi:hypothetical protein